MARGFLSGILIGSVVAVGGAAVLSLIVDPPDPPKPEATALEVPAGSEFNQSRRDEQADLPASEPQPDAAQVPKVTAPATDDLAALDDSDMQPAAVPQAGAAQDALVAPGESESAQPVVEAESPISPAEPSQGPASPTSEADVSISTDPAQPKPPSADTQQTPFTEETEVAGAGPVVQSDAPAEPVSPGTDGETAEIVAAETSGSEELVIKVSPEPAPEAAPQETPAIAEVDTPAVSKQAAPAAADAPDAVQPAEDATPEIAAASESAPESSMETEAPLVIRPSAEPAGEGEAGAGATVRIGKPAGSLIERPAGATVRRPAEAVPPAGDTAAADGAAPAGPPVERFAVPFELPENKPGMAIVLIDDPDSSVGIEALSTFPYPLSFAIDTSRPDAADRMAIYRAAGFEVLAMVALPEAAAPGDVEVAMQALMARVPEAVGVMETPAEGIQKSRNIAAQVTEILRDSGHGLVLFPKGLNTAQKLAAKEGVPSAAIFRDFDAKGEKPSVIRRFLNYAVLKAGSEGSVVMVGRLRPDTVTALLLWGLEDRAGDVALAPVSALLQVQPQ